MERKNINFIITLIISLGLFVGIMIAGLPGPGSPDQNLIPPEYISDFVVVLPGMIYTDVIFLYLFPVIGFTLFYLLCPVVIFVLLAIHKLVKRGARYGIDQIGKKMKGLDLFNRTLLVNFFSFSIASLLVQLGYGDLFRGGMVEPDKPIYAFHQAEATFLGTFLFTSIGMLLFIPLWLMEDSGLVMYRVYPGFRKTPDIEGTHGMYLNILKGYSGISTLLSLAIYTYNTIVLIDDWRNPAVLTPAILIGLPFIITGLFSIPLVLYEKLLPKMTSKLVPVLEKLGFKPIKIPTLEDIQDDRINVDN
jgi:hypothetical protein